MLIIKEPSEQLFSIAQKGLLEIKSQPTPFDIHSAQKGAQYAECNFEGYIDYLNKNKSEQQLQGRVPSTTLWLFEDQKFVGIFDVRHRLNETLMQRGGHIAYYIIPSERGRGYTLKGLKLVLDWCFENLNLNEVLLFSDEQNIRSLKVLEHALRKFGGRRLDKHQAEGHIECGYWIKTK